MSLFSTSQTSKENADFEMSMIQSAITEALFSTNTSQTSVQALNFSNVNCEGDLVISDIDFSNSATSTSTASSNVQQGTTQDSTMSQSMTQAASQVAKGMSVGSTKQTVKQNIDETMMASQYTKSVASVDCAVTQSNEQYLNVTDASVGGDCTITDVTFGNNLESVSNCTQVAVQTTSQVLDMSQDGSQTSTQKAVGFSMVGIILVLLVVLYFLYGFVSTVYRVFIPWILIGLGVFSALWGAGYYLAYEYPQAKKQVDVDYLTSDSSDNSASTTDCTAYTQVEANRVSLSPPLTYWMVTQPTKVAELAGGGGGSSQSLTRMYTNRTFSSQYSTDANSLLEKQMDLNNSLFSGTLDATPSCTATSTAANGLRYIYTSYDFGGDEITRCGKGASDAGADACTRTDGAAGIIDVDDKDNFGRDYESSYQGTGTYTGTSAYRNILNSVGVSLAECNGWATSTGDGLLQNVAFGSRGDAQPFTSVQSTLLRALPWFKHHITNDPDNSTNFNVVVFVAPYGADANCSDPAVSQAWEGAGYAPNTCMPHFWFLLCFHISDETVLENCLLELGGSDAVLPQSVTDCEDCTDASGCCSDFKTGIGLTNWYAGEVSGQYGNDGPRVIQQLAGNALSGSLLYSDQVGLQARMQVAPSDPEITKSGGYYYPRCHSQVESTATGCNYDANVPLSGKSDNVCCRPSDCGVSEWSNAYYDSNGNVQGPLGKINPACYMAGMVPCVDVDNDGNLATICGSDTGPLPKCSDVIPFGSGDDTAKSLNTLVQLNVGATFSGNGTDENGASYSAGDYLYTKSGQGSSATYSSSVSDLKNSNMIAEFCSSGYSAIASDAGLINTMPRDSSAANPNCYTGYSTSTDLSTMDTGGYDPSTGLAGLPQNFYSSALSALQAAGVDTSGIDQSTVVVENPSQRCATASMIQGINTVEATSGFIPLFNICGLSGIPGFEGRQFKCNPAYGGVPSDTPDKFGNVTTFAEAAERMCGGNYTLGWGLAPHAFPFTIGQDGVVRKPWQGFEPPDVSGNEYCDILKGSNSQADCKVPLYAEDENQRITSLWAICRCPPMCDSLSAGSTTQSNQATSMIPTMIMAWQSNITATTTTDAGSGSDTTEGEPGLYLWLGITFIVLGLIAMGLGAYILYDNSASRDRTTTTRNTSTVEVKQVTGGRRPRYY